MNPVWIAMALFFMSVGWLVCTYIGWNPVTGLVWGLAGASGWGFIRGIMR